VRRRRRSRSLLRLGLRTISPEPINRPSWHLALLLPRIRSEAVPVFLKASQIRFQQPKYSLGFPRLPSLQIWTLRSSVRFAAAPAPPKPRDGDRAGGAGSRSALGARKLTTVPLQSERIASHFSTMSLRGSATFDRRIKADGTTAAVLVRVRRVGATFAPARCARACNIAAVTETGSIELRAWHGVRFSF